MPQQQLQREGFQAALQAQPAPLVEQQPLLFLLRSLAAAEPQLFFLLNIRAKHTDRGHAAELFRGPARRARVQPILKLRDFQFAVLFLGRRLRVFGALGGQLRFQRAFALRARAVQHDVLGGGLVFTL
jgi:hypothetical protein